MEWTGNEMVRMDHAGKIIKKLNTETIDYWEIDIIGDMITDYHKQFHLSQIPNVTIDASNALDYIHDVVCSLPEWLRGGATHKA